MVYRLEFESALTLLVGFLFMPKERLSPETAPLVIENRSVSCKTLLAVMAAQSEFLS